MKTYQVIYLWRGERHRDLSTTDVHEAKALVEEYRREGWQAWMEVL